MRLPYRKYILVPVALIAAIGASCAQFWIGQVSGLISFAPTWQDLRLGAGGASYGISIYPDGTMLSHNDTLGGYIFKVSGTCVGANNSSFQAPCWQQVVTATSLPPSAVAPGLIGSGNLGVAELVACASNTNVLYMLYTNEVYVSINRGATWVSDNLMITTNGNKGPLNNKKIACDPNNSDVVYVSTPSSYVTYTTNGRSGNSATWTNLTGLAQAMGTDSDGNGLGSAIAFDPSSSASGGFTQHFMICINGTGCYETSNGGTAGGGSFSVASGPTTIVQLAADKFSQFWVASNTTNIYRHASGAWTTLTPGFTSSAIAIDPNSTSLGANSITGISAFSGQIVVSTNNGSSWTGLTNNPGQSASSPQPVWLNVANQVSAGVNFFSGSQIAFDESSNLWMGAGLGVWETSQPLAVSPNTVWNANTVGIEQLVTNQIISPPGNSPLAAVWDKGVFLIKNPDQFPSVYWDNSTSFNAIMGGWSVDYCGSAPNTIVVLERSNLDSSYAPAISSDGGNTWTTWRGNPSSPDVGGSVACSTPSNIVVIPGQNTTLQYTTNGASSWALSTATGNNGWISNYVNNRQPLAADRVMGGVFYAVDLGTGAAGSQKFWVSTDNGATFTSPGTPFDGNVYNDQLISVPGQAGNLFYIPGAQASFNNGHLWKSTNQGATWSCITATGSSCSGATLSDLQAVGFGAAKPGGSGYPMIYVLGFLSGTFGYYSSADGGTTWTAINVPLSSQVWAGNSIDDPTWITGDPNVYGRIYVGMRGSGGTYIDTADACPWVNFSNINPNAALTGTVTLTAQHSGLVPVSSVQFSVDGTNIGSAQTGSGPYSVSWVTSGVATGAHTLKVAATGNGCTGSFSIPITTSANDLDPASNDNTPVWLEKVV